MSAPPPALASLTSRGTNKAPREVILRRSSKWSFASQKWREAKSGAFCFLLAGIATLIGLLATAGLHVPGGIVCGMLIGVAAVAPVWWYSEFRRAPRLRRQRQMATVEATRLELPAITFNDGSTDRFRPTDVLRSEKDIVIAIDAHRMLVRMITHAEWPDEGIDWVYELPNNMDIDVADYPRRFRKGKKVPSLIFSSEEEDGFQVTGFALAPESIAPARALVAQLKRQRPSAD